VIWLQLSAGAMVLTAGAHSVLGERRLIVPILALDGEIMRKPLARRIVRLAWHFTSLLMILSAVTVLWAETPPAVIVVTGAVWLAVGLIDAVVTRGQHVGWPLLAASGAFALLGSLA
jgi:hypothetical protein